MRKNRLFNIIIFLCAASACKAGSFYVSPSGNGNGTLSAPFKTIQQAADIAKAGDTIFIAGGYYSEMNICFKHSGNETDGYIVCCAQPGSGKVVLSQTDNTDADNNVAFMDISNKSHIWIEGIEFSNVTCLKACITMTNASQCVITGNRFIHLGNPEVNVWGGTAMVRLYNSADCVISHNSFEDITGDAIAFEGQNTKRNLFCNNTFKDLKGKKRNWSEDNYRFSSAITGTDTSFGNNVICFNDIAGGQDGIWLDRDASRNIIVRNIGQGGLRLIFNESRCAHNWFQENIACDMSESGYRSALYEGTGWSSDTRWINNIAFNCKVGLYLHKSKHNEVRNNIICLSSDKNLICTDSTIHYGQNIFRNNLWYAPEVPNSMEYGGKTYTPYIFGTRAKEKGGIYNKAPQFACTTSPYDFSLKDTSPCTGTGDENVDIGAYPIYGPSPIGCTPEHEDADVEAYFERAVTEVLRNKDYVITIRLNRVSDKETAVCIRPVAGDIREGTDYELKEKNILFRPGERTKEVTISFKGDETAYSKLLVLKIDNEGEGRFDGRTYTAFKLLTQAEHEDMLNSDIWLEAEDGDTGSLWNILTDHNASSDKYVTVKNGNNSNNDAPDNEDGWIKHVFNVSTESTYALWMRTICPNANDDSFWIRMDNGQWEQWNGIPSSTAWQWNLYPKTFYLTEGIHELYIGYREDGAKLDKMLLSYTGTLPTGKGEFPTEISLSIQKDDLIDHIEYFNLSGQRLHRISGQGLVIKKIYYHNNSVKTTKTIIR